MSNFLDGLLGKKKPKGEAKAPEAEKGTSQAQNPYLNARRTMNERVGLFLQKIRAWQIMALLAFALNMVLLVMLSDAYHTPKYVPYIVELDKLGVIVNAQPAQMSATADDRVIKATVAQFVQDMRLVTPDITLQRRAVNNVFAHLTTFDPARRTIERWYSVDPLTRSREILVSTEIQSILLQGNTTWQVEWIETTRDHAGDLISRETYRALVTIYQAQSSESDSEEFIRANPLSLYIKDISWAKVALGGK